MLWGVFLGTLEVAMNTQAVAVENALRRPVMPMFHGSWSLGALTGAGIGTAAVASGTSLTSQLLVLGVISLAALTILTSQLLPDDRTNLDHASVDRTPTGQRLAHRSRADPVRDRSGRHALRRSRSRLVGRVPALIPTGLGRDTRARLHPLLTCHGDNQVRAAPASLPGGPDIACCPASPRSPPSDSPSGWPHTTRLITLIAFCCLGAGCALVIPTTYSTVGETTSANPGRAVALVSGIGWVGFVAGPPLIGQIASATSLRLALTIIPALTALITGLMIATGALSTGSNGTLRRSTETDPLAAQNDKASLDT